MLFVIIFGTLSFPITENDITKPHNKLQEFSTFCVLTVHFSQELTELYRPNFFPSIEQKWQQERILLIIIMFVLTNLHSSLNSKHNYHINSWLQFDKFVFCNWLLYMCLSYCKAILFSLLILGSDFDYYVVFDAASIVYGAGFMQRSNIRPSVCPVD